MSTASPTPLPDLDKLLDFSDPAASEAAYRELLPQARRLGADAELALLTRIARTLGLQGRYDEALALLDEVETHAPQAGPEVAVRLLLEDGRVLNSSGQVDASAAFFEEAYTRAQEAGLVGLAVDAAHMLGIVLPPDPALEWNMDAIHTAETSTKPAAQQWLGALYNHTGWSLMDRGEYDQALTLFEKGLAWRQARDDEDATRIARHNLAECLAALGGDTTGT
ncbi:MAG: tetratricopeptide repeat protein [Oligoflexia bacterium]|nr:tetratricopeptide repeat protein [Oligoflexia bacterium]